ncbi:phosphatase PAP2 family protein [Argonema antarcticum]|uniref:phosphatase PAP2 family protein n=1 Tax=Argonema antarcticum TaxID=2942763 RepID=UPI002011EF6C|nr:phosphatase PAP2 family protein [Argonema antarcticum]MCL1473115.1 phosphatase PAP2 family protein [Argonema antarcticum A004/B2]
MKSKLYSWFSSLVAATGKVRLYISLFILLPLIFLSQEVREKKVFEFEVAFLQWLHEVINPISGYILSVFYLIGDTHIAALVVVTSLGILWWKRYWREAMTLAFASLSVLLLVDEILKPFFARRRPPERIDKTAGGFGYPSGHATGNLVLYFYLAYLLAARYPKLSIYIYGVTTLFLLLMGLSSMYLRVHWPSDIIGGYAFGYIWLTICLAILNFSGKKEKKY